ncbi:Organic cation transporter protein [Gryllus bimaculatus]|nr:Organic cation transporter protein [Gryllus bimaculatus]
MRMHKRPLQKLLHPLPSPSPARTVSPGSEPRPPGSAAAWRNCGSRVRMGPSGTWCDVLESVQSRERKMAETSASAVDLDEILEEVGQFGKYQITSYLLISLPIFFTVISGTSYVFTAGDLDYRCHIPECLDSGNQYMPPWIANAVPFEGKASHRIPSRCLRYEPANENITSYSPHSVSCPAEMFLNTTIRCNKWVYQRDESTIASEWDITCDENQWKLTLVGTVNSIGYFVTTPIAGYTSDRFGRKAVLLGAISLACFSGLARSFANNYEVFLLWEFLDMALGGSIYETAFVLGMELVGPEKRVLGGAIISAYNGLGEVFLGLIAWAVPYWRWMLRVIYGPAIFLLLYFWILPESVRWLIAHGRMNEADSIIQKAARVNGVVLSDKYLNMMRAASSLEQQTALKDDKADAESTDSVPLKDVLIEVFQSRVLLLRLFVCCCCSCVNMFVFYGLSLNSVTVAGNKYLNFILVSLIELPGYLATYLGMDRFGRKMTLCASLTFSGACCTAYIFVANVEADWMRLVLFMAGKFGITISFTVMYVYATEMFPTQLRHSLLGTCSMFGGLGITVAPQTPLLSRYMEALPLLLFGGMSLATAVLALLLPETVGTKLPDTVEEAENIGRKPVPLTPPRRFSQRDVFSQDCVQSLTLKSASSPDV